MSTVPFARRSHPSTTSILDAALPHNLDAEKYVLGAVLVNSDALKAATDKGLDASHFFKPGDAATSVNGRIFFAMLELDRYAAPIELLTLKDFLRADLEMTAYISSLADGVPRVGNVGHYAEVIVQKARERQFVYKMGDYQQRILEGDSFDQVLTESDLYLKQVSAGSSDRLVCLEDEQFLEMNWAPVDFVIEPILPVASSGMLYSPTGAGKTFISLYMAYCVATGTATVFVWDIPLARPVVYVDAEMDAPTMNERLRQIRNRCGKAKKGYFRLITPDAQKNGIAPRINSKEGRDRIEDHLRGGELLVLDNLSTLCPGSDEDESGNWAMTQEWILYLRRKGITVFIDHHAGKSGTQLGTSKKEFQLSCNLRLTLPKGGKKHEDGLRVFLEFDKLRSRGKKGFRAIWGQPFEISLTTENDVANFTHRPLRGVLRKKALEMLEAGMRENDVAADLNLDRYTIYRLKKKMSNPDFPDDDELPPLPTPPASQSERLPGIGT
jgi:hypothetical protein